MKSTAYARRSTILTACLVITVGAALAAYVHNTTSSVQKALAAEVLQQQHDVASLIHEYAGVMLALERVNADSRANVRAELKAALNNADLQLLLMRSNYSFERLDGASKAHAYVKPVLEDVQQWLGGGLPGVDPNRELVIRMAIKRMHDRYAGLRRIAAETDDVATSLIAAQSAYLQRFRDSLILLLGACVLLTLGIAALFMRQRNLLARLASEQKQHAQRFKDFADIGADWMWEADTGLMLVQPAPQVVGRAAVRANTSDKFSMAGCGTSEMIPAVFAAIVEPHWPIDEMLAHQEFSNVEVVWTDAEGNDQMISLSGKPLMDSKGRFQGFRGVGRDITARKRMERELEQANLSLIEAETRGREQAEDALRSSEKFLRATLDALTTEVAILGNTGKIIATNAAWKRFIAEFAPEFADGGVGRQYLKVFGVRPDSEFESIRAVTSEIESVLAGHRNTLLHEYRCLITDEQRWIVVTLTTFDTNAERYAVLVREDVTVRRTLEERDRRLRAELAHATRLTTAGEMASGLAHELNQPLTAISHNSDALLSSIQEQGSADEEVMDMANDIYSQAQHAGGIIRSLRQLLRKETVYTNTVVINRLVEETVRLTHPEARERNVNVTLNLAENLPNPDMDSVQIQQVLVNLERNGVESNEWMRMH